jgi:hypothetical protein
VYLSAHRHASLSVLEDQQLAGAVMWTAVTIIYFDRRSDRRDAIAVAISLSVEGPSLIEA